MLAFLYIYIFYIYIFLLVLNCQFDSTNHFWKCVRIAGVNRTWFHGISLCTAVCMETWNQARDAEHEGASEKVIQADNRVLRLIFVATGCDSAQRVQVGNNSGELCSECLYKIYLSPNITWRDYVALSPRAHLFLAKTKTGQHYHKAIIGQMISLSSCIVQPLENY